MPRRIVLLALLALLAVPAPALAAERVIVGFAPSADAGDRAAARAEADARLIATLGDPRQQVLSVDGDPDAAVAALEDAPGVAYAEPDAIVRAQWAPNDPFLGAQWALAATGVPAGWDIARGAGALVGVVDTGAELGHPDLGRFAANPGETPANGVDDDGNGRTDDVHGYDFVNADGDPADDQGHGTGVTGVIAASADNGLGVAGVAPAASIVQAKALAANGSGYTSDVTAGLRYVASRGARVVNLSLGGPSSSAAMSAAFAAHPQTLFVAAAGNDGVDNDAPGGGAWPCNDPAPNVICAGASTSADGRASFSNTGTRSVDLMAPGASVRSTALGAGYTDWSGTSFSAPMVAGAAALLYSARPGATVAQVRAALLGSVDPVAGFGPLTVTGGRLNARAALTALTGEAPAPTPAPPAGPVPVPASAPVPASPFVPGPAGGKPASRPAQPRPATTKRKARCASPRRGSRRARSAARRCRALAAARSRAATRARLRAAARAARP